VKKEFSSVFGQRNVILSFVTSCEPPFGFDIAKNSAAYPAIQVAFLKGKV
jgi:hypothetical protein